VQQRPWNVTLQKPWSRDWLFAAKARARARVAAAVRKVLACMLRTFVRDVKAEAAAVMSKGGKEGGTQ
jgi:hypothetical protein